MREREGPKLRSLKFEEMSRSQHFRMPQSEGRLIAR